MIYELRTYEAAPGRMPELNARFRDHTLRIFANHGMDVVGFWTYGHGGWSDQLVYMMKFDDMDDRARKWASFIADEEWHRVYAESQPTARSRVRSDILTPTDYSPLP